MKQIKGGLSRGRAGVMIAGVLLLVGCCDEAALEACRQQQAQMAQLAPVEVAQGTRSSAGPFLLEAKSSSDVALEAEVVNAGCDGSKGHGAEVKVSWKVSRSGVNGVRITVAEGSAAGKLWMEGGAVGEGVTGPWINDGSRLVLEDQVSGTILAEVSAIAQACDGGGAR
ncbi:MAG: hypothetical protein J0I01_15185 [Stenotrophomonas nitritireducens]|uniref:hypothetical protein n=1 Tax=Stenotrophomonas nitritireducens TaxID=83617 RepID=UPI001ACFE750|nr:hypothetical protein [Stenotrophomonas nitritireducens]MBN8793567.1 hypothetical protein [Stenotrophomonas nitritireducens]MBN8797138.1 hypothetical protein [Stenotrophomonas nitritireducens]